MRGFQHYNILCCFAIVDFTSLSYRRYNDKNVFIDGFEKQKIFLLIFWNTWFLESKHPKNFFSSKNLFHCFFYPACPKSIKFFIYRHFFFMKKMKHSASLFSFSIFFCNKNGRNSLEKVKSNRANIWTKMIHIFSFLIYFSFHFREIYEIIEAL